jgi:hypothetical protein
VIFLTQREEYEQYYTDGTRYFEFGDFYEEYGKGWDERNLPLEYEEERSDDGVEIYERWQALNG